ncbi:hypothetical protein [Salmonella enterica]|uniref:hypothetical protein n=1 Tax=Salmonella enterica TaxID=28901 RepID=UPI000FE36FDA|nr:hypothetical protein [Salmonella enterica]RWR70149.1 hypothetical protein EPJ92_04635 [Salmonella enterica subsp. enterica serovar Typhimurium]
MSLNKALLFLLLLMGTGVNASTREEIERLYNPHGMAAPSGQKQPADTQGVQKVTPAPRWFRPAPPEVMQTFFPNIPVATPTTFLVNVNTLEALPLLQGATDAAGFMARMDTVLQMYGEKHAG